MCTFCAAWACARSWRCGEEWGGELFVEAEEVLDAGLVVGEGFGAVEAVDGAVECLVGAEEVGGHVEGVVQVS